MPKATVNEHRDSAFGECNVGSDELPVNPDWVILAKAITQLMESRPQSDFWLRVTPLDGGHVA